MKEELTDQQRFFLESKLQINLNDMTKQIAEELRGKQVNANNTGRIKNIDYLYKTIQKLAKYNPLLSSNLNEENYFNIATATKENLLTWLQSPQAHQRQLEGLSQYLSFAIGQYGTLVNTANAGKAFNYVLLPPSIDSENEVRTKAFQSDYKKAKIFLQKINLKNQLARVDLGVLYNGIEFVYLKKLKNTIALYKLPTQYCKITAPFSYGWRFSLDLTCFDTLANFDKDVIPELTTAYNKFVEMRRKKDKNLSTYQYYQMSPSDSWVFTSNLYFPLGVPTYASTMSSALDMLSYNELITSKLTYDLYKIIAFKIPTNPSTQEPSLDKNVVVDYIKDIDAVLPDNVIPTASPFETSGVNISQTDNMDVVSNLGQQAVSNTSGTPQQILGSGDLKNGNSLKIASKTNIERSNSAMYKQYENFINYQLMNLCEKYPFRISIFGNAFNRNEEISTYVDVTRRASVGSDYLLATLGIEPFQIQSHAALLRTMDLKDVYTPPEDEKTEVSEPEGKQKTVGGEQTDGGANHDEYDDNT